MNEQLQEARASIILSIIGGIFMFALAILSCHLFNDGTIALFLVPMSIFIPVVAISEYKKIKEFIRKANDGGRE